VTSIAASHFRASNCANLPQNHVPHQSAKFTNKEMAGTEFMANPTKETCHLP
jgi:hypothetical protein